MKSSFTPFFTDPGNFPKKSGLLSWFLRPSKMRERENDKKTEREKEGMTKRQNDKKDRMIKKTENRVLRLDWKDE